MLYARLHNDQTCLHIGDFWYQTTANVVLQDREYPANAGVTIGLIYSVSQHQTDKCTFNFKDMWYEVEKTSFVQTGDTTFVANGYDHVNATQTEMAAMAAYQNQF